MLKTATCLYENGDIQRTAVNGNLSDEQIKSYWVGKYFNLGCITYDHEKGCEVEIDKMVKCVEVWISEFNYN